MDWNAVWGTISSTCTTLAFRLVGALAVFFIGRLIIRLILKHFPNGSKKHPLDPTARQFLISIAKAALYLILIVSIVGILGIPLASVVTVVGAVGAAIALALQGSLSNLAAGVMLLIFRPLRVGEYVGIGDAEGTVSEIGIYYTILLTIDNRQITIPNSALTNTTITNYTREQKRRVDLVFSVSHGTDAEKAKSVIYDVISSHPLTIAEPEPFVRLTAISDSSLDFTVRVWCLTENYWSLRFDLTEQVKAALDQNGITIPFPQIDVHMK